MADDLLDRQGGAVAMNINSGEAKLVIL